MESQVPDTLRDAIIYFADFDGLGRHNRSPGFRVHTKFLIPPFFGSLRPVNAYIFYCPVLILLCCPCFGTSIAVRILREQEAAIGADSRRSGMDSEGNSLGSIDDTCKICTIKNGVLIEANVNPKELRIPLCDTAREIAERTSVVTERLDQFISIFTPAFQDFVEGLRSAPALIQYYTSHGLEAAFIQVDGSRVTWGRVLLSATVTESKIRITQRNLKTCPPDCRPFFFLGSQQAWIYEQANRRSLAHLSPVDFVKTVITEAGKTDQAVGGPISVVTIDPVHLVQWIDYGVCPTDHTKPKTTAKKKR